jgi:hypothetical protein
VSLVTGRDAKVIGKTNANENVIVKVEKNKLAETKEGKNKSTKSRHDFGMPQEM